MWNDDDIDNLIKDSFKEYWKVYQLFPYHILKLDFSRYAMLYMYGGIYVDMDMFCYKNFYDELDHDTILLQSPFKDEIVQDSMIISSKHNEFMLYCMNESQINYYTYHNVSERINYIKNVCGPYQISKCYESWKDKIKILEHKRYNPVLDAGHDENIVTRHMLTGMWGKEYIKYVYGKVNKECQYQDYLIDSYLRNRKIDLKNFNFFKKLK